MDDSLAITVCSGGALFHAQLFSAAGSADGWRSWRAGSNYQGWVKDNEEHIAWIRGHHAPDAEATRALRTAYALAARPGDLTHR